MSGNKFNIRQATLADAPFIAAMTYQLIEEEEDRIISDAEQRTILAYILKSFFQDKNTYALVAEKSKRGKPRRVGMVALDARLGYDSDLIVWGHWLYVEPKYRGKGAAEELVGVGEQLANELGAKKIVIQTLVPEFFKRKLGYKYCTTMLEKDLVGDKHE